VLSDLWRRPLPANCHIPGEVALYRVQCKPVVTGQDAYGQFVHGCGHFTTSQVVCEVSRRSVQDRWSVLLCSVNVNLGLMPYRRGVE
jgi:hypothetical protein